LLLPVLLMLPLLGALGWWIVGRGLAPIDEIAQTLGQRHPASLDPVAASPVPIELQPLVAALDALLQRLDQSFDAQRRFAADAAHELRTPLTALSMQIQLAERAATPDERDAAFERLKQGIKRATRLVQQLLVLAAWMRTLRSNHRPRWIWRALQPPPSTNIAKPRRRARSHFTARWPRTPACEDKPTRCTSCFRT
jgi:signal transduction histidine kinase